MSESTCLMQPFSHPSKEGNGADLGESISFGRFMSEPLAWEKWSSFNQNRYLEEVEKFSKPGSVAQKKAYFEEHYKRLAEKKAAAAAAAAREGENSVTNDSSHPELDTGLYDGSVVETEHVGSDCSVNVKALCDAERKTEVSIGCDSKGETGFKSIDVQVDVVTEDVPKDNSVSTVSPNRHENVESRVAKEVETNTAMSSEKLQSKGNSSANQDSPASTVKRKPGSALSKTMVKNRATPARLRTPANSGKENNPILSSKKTPKGLLNKERPSLVQMSLNFSTSRAGETNTTMVQKNQDSRLTKTPKKLSSPLKSNTTTIQKNKVSRVLPKTPKKGSSPLKPSTTVFEKNRDSRVTVSKNKTPKKGSSPLKPSTTSVQKADDSRVAICSTKTPKKCPTPLNTNTAIVKKNKDSRVAFCLTKTPKNCPSPQNASTMLQPSGNVVRKRPPVTPHLDSKRTKASLEHIINRSRKMDVKAKTHTLNHSKSPSTSEIKSSSSVSFTLRSEERAARRKEYFQKLEEEHNAKEAQEMQLQEKYKEKAENELRKLRQNLGFKAKPMPDFYRDPQSPKAQLKKIPLTCPRSPKLGRKPNSTSVNKISSSLPKKLPVKTDDLKQVMDDKASRTPTRSVRSTPKKNADENACPNTQMCASQTPTRSVRSTPKKNADENASPNIQRCASRTPSRSNKATPEKNVLVNPSPNTQS